MQRAAIGSGEVWTKHAAFRYCERLAHTHYENFTVGSWFLPRDKRHHVYAIYGYCRSVDDLGDEDTPSPSVGEGLDGGDPPHLSPPPPGEMRLALLDWWQAELEACYSGTPSHPVMVALQDTIRAFDIPPQPFLKLVEANRMDQRTQRHLTYDELLRYCDHSANPVGHLFLYLFDYRDAERQQLADFTCTALQLTNFWQDVARDYQMGRIYLPMEDLNKFGYSEQELAQGVVNDCFRTLMAFEVQRALDLFRRGAALVETLEGSLKLDVALFTRGGLAVLRAIQRQGYDVLSARPSLSRATKARILLSTWAMWKMGKLGLPHLCRELQPWGRRKVQRD